MTLVQAQAISRAVVLGTVALAVAVAVGWLAWDWWAFRRFGHEATESHYIWSLSQRRPLLFLPPMLLAVFLAWHWFVGAESAPGGATP